MSRNEEPEFYHDKKFEGVSLETLRNAPLATNLPRAQCIIRQIENNEPPVRVVSAPDGKRTLKTPVGVSLQHPDTKQSWTFLVACRPKAGLLSVKLAEEITRKQEALDEAETAADASLQDSEKPTRKKEQATATTFGTDELWVCPRRLAAALDQNWGFVAVPFQSDPASPELQNAAAKLMETTPKHIRLYHIGSNMMLCMDGALSASLAPLEIMTRLLNPAPVAAASVAARG
ncbi:hypothetical protein CAOG_07618 [Capsaspora owczarzaki ATCC 30864]|uniref:Uncharacterized protein n=1 Tax=Capsaspora owczarzaki (strain ATCC 30864) TaxID=595528 RepID=A0A0D2WWY6_CAPO3|nr:hypothetical protein CAOG_07618 [Capsaspora owczarzaki ATCC 30864]KJE97168.1 hypothetical protein CAOG_007618 [Capsaspora owczarzaki ATCC 30864]|eukprot:XP_004343492.1 hypothetical protein CAOG_07618 [Capsaspora owczarzaki ATCC 30864]